MAIVEKWTLFCSTILGTKIEKPIKCMHFCVNAWLCAIGFAIVYYVDQIEGEIPISGMEWFQSKMDYYTRIKGVCIGGPINLKLRSTCASVSFGHFWTSKNLKLMSACAKTFFWVVINLIFEVFFMILWVFFVAKLTDT